MSLSQGLETIQAAVQYVQYVKISFDLASKANQAVLDFKHHEANKEKVIIPQRIPKHVSQMNLFEKICLHYEIYNAIDDNISDSFEYPIVDMLNSFERDPKNLEQKLVQNGPLQQYRQYYGLDNKGQLIKQEAQQNQNHSSGVKQNQTDTYIKLEKNDEFIREHEEEIAQKQNQKIIENPIHDELSGQKIDKKEKSLGVSKKRTPEMTRQKAYHMIDQLKKQRYIEDLKMGGLTTGFNVVRKGLEIHKKNGSNEQIFKECVKQFTKGGVGICGKMLQTKLAADANQQKIMQSLENYSKIFECSSANKIAINFGVEVVKQVVNLITSDEPCAKSFKSAGEKAVWNGTEFAVNHFVGKGIEKGCEEFGIQVAKRTTNYAANTVASTMGKQIVLNTSREIVEQGFKSSVINSADDVVLNLATNTGKTTLKQVGKSTTNSVFVETLKSSAKSNLIFGVGGFVVGTAFDVLARDKPIKQAAKENAKSAIGSAIGSSLFAAIGSVVPVIGTAAGGFLGGILGGLAASWF